VITYSEALLVLMGIVALVLLLACANLSGLLVARAASRGAGDLHSPSHRRWTRKADPAVSDREFRFGRPCRNRGFAAGVLVQQHPGHNHGERRRTLSTAHDWRVLTFTAGISLLACVLAGLAPGLHALRVSLNSGLQQPRSGGHRRLGGALVIAQVSISMVLVTGSALFAATMVKLYSVDSRPRRQFLVSSRKLAPRAAGSLFRRVSLPYILQCQG
jgi:hypothetical protein